MVSSSESFTKFASEEPKSSVSFAEDPGDSPGGGIPGAPGSPGSSPGSPRNGGGPCEQPSSAWAGLPKVGPLRSFRQTTESQVSRVCAHIAEELEDLVAILAAEHEKTLRATLDRELCEESHITLGRASQGSCLWDSDTESRSSKRSSGMVRGSLGDLGGDSYPLTGSHELHGGSPRHSKPKFGSLFKNKAAPWQKFKRGTGGGSGGSPRRPRGSDTRGSMAAGTSNYPAIRESTDSGNAGDTNHAEVLSFWVQADAQTKRMTERLTVAKACSMVSLEDDVVHTIELEMMPRWIKFLQARVTHPSSVRRLVWDIIGLLLIVYDIAVIPLQFFDPLESESTRALGWFSRLFWTCDIPTGFLTGFLVKDGNMEMRLGKIARRYIRSWLLIDIVVVLFDWIDVVLRVVGGSDGGGMGEVGAARMGKTMRIMRMLRILRLVRIAKLPILAGTWLETYIRSEKVMLVASMGKLMLFIVTLMHFIACTWYAIGQGYGQEDGWVRVFEGDHAVLYRYMTSFHWSLTQFTGTMEVVPATVGERIFAVLVLLTAFVVSAAFVSNITSSMTRLNMISGNEASMFAGLRDYLVDKGITRKLTVRVQRNAHHALMESRQNCPEANVELLQIISEPLRMDIHFELYAPILRWHPLFRCLEDESPASVRKLCHVGVCTTFLSPGDVLFSDGEVKDPPEMYFVTKGEMRYKQATGPGTRIEIGAWTSEPVLWCHWVHRGVLRARTVCELLSLDACTFRTIAHQNKTPNLNLGRYAIEYVKLINKHALTDRTPESVSTEAMRLAFDWESEKRNSAGAAASVTTFRSFVSRRASAMWTPSSPPGWSRGRLESNQVKDMNGAPMPTLVVPGSSAAHMRRSLTSPAVPQANQQMQLSLPSSLIT